MSSNFNTMPPAARKLRALEKRNCLLSFIAEEGYTTTAICQRVLGLQNWPTLTALHALEKQACLTRDVLQTETGAVPLWGITSHGLALANPNCGDDDLHYTPGRISAASLAHTLDVQRVRVLSSAQCYRNWRSSRRCQREAAKTKGVWLNVPDAVAHDVDGLLVAFEIERVFKSPRRYESIFAGYLRMAHLRTIDRVVYISMTAGLAPRLQRQFERIKTVVVEGRRLPVTDAHLARLKVIDFVEWQKLAVNFPANDLE